MQFTDSSESDDEEQELKFEEISTTKMGETSVKYSSSPGTILGNGITAIVYPGYHFGINKPAAVKFIKKQYLRVQNDQVNELKIWSEIDQNINIIRLFDSYRDPYAGLFLAMEKAERTFRKQIEKFIPSRDQVIAWLHQVCKAVGYLHEKHVIHRDIKPDNILMVLQDGKLVAKLADFGVSKMISSAERTGTFSMASGTLLWMAPEALENKTQKFKNTKMLDIYALGMTIYFGLSKGGHPFSSTGNDVLTSHISATRGNNTTSKKLSGDQVDANHLITAMMEKDPLNRPQIGEVVDNCIFWNWERKHIFLIRVAICLSKQDCPEIKEIKNHIDKEYKLHYWLVNGRKHFNWIGVASEFCLDIPKLLFNSRKRKYRSEEYGDGSCVTKFLKLFRDKYVHYPDMNEHGAFVFRDGDVNFCEEQYVKILTIACPSLTEVLYRVLSRHRNFNCLSPLRKLYFPWKLVGTNTEGNVLKSDFENYFDEYEQCKRRRDEKNNGGIQL